MNSNERKNEGQEMEQVRGPVSRRFFLKGSGIAAIGIAAATASATGLAADAAPASLNYTASFARLGARPGKTLVRMARDIFPHDKLPDELYAAAVAGYDQQSADDGALKSLILSGITQMDTIAVNRYGKPYAELPLESERLEVLYAIENTPFFEKIRGGLITGLYNNKAVWPLLGYEGSSWQFGGYLDRGFNDLTWL